MDAISKCEHHESEEVRFYCEQCKVTVCDDCIIGPHKGHNVIKLKEYGIKQKNLFLKTIAEAEATKILEIQTTIETAKIGQSTFQTSVSGEINGIKSNREVLNKILDDLQNDLIENFHSEEKVGVNEFTRFIKRQEKRLADINEIIESVKSKGTDILDTDVAKYHVTLEKLLEFDPYSDTVPVVPPPRYQCNDAFRSRGKLQHIIGYLESGHYADVALVKTTSAQDKDNSPQNKTVEEQSKRESSLENETHTIYNMESTLEDGSDYYSTHKYMFSAESSCNIEGGVVFIVPQDRDRRVWIIGKQRQLFEADFSGNNTTMKSLKTLDQVPIAASANTKGELILSFQNKKSLTQLQVSTARLSRKAVFSLIATSISTDGRQVCCICRCCSKSDEDLIVCLFDKLGNDGGGKYIFRFHSSGQSSITREVILASNKLEIKSPVHVSNSTDGSLCIVCHPETVSSWILVVDKFGALKFRYPANNDYHESYDFVGGGFLQNGYITVTNRTSRDQLLIDDEGHCVQKNKFDEYPVWSVVDNHDNIWIAFDNGKVELMRYTEEHVYCIPQVQQT